MTARWLVAKRKATALMRGYGSCGRCGRGWHRAEGHTTTYCTFAGGSRGMFPLCERCWTRLGSVESRLPYYVELAERWGRDDAPTAATLRLALEQEAS